jgi:hypothetical protein
MFHRDIKPITALSGFVEFHLANDFAADDPGLAQVCPYECLPGALFVKLQTKNKGVAPETKQVRARLWALTDLGPNRHGIVLSFTKFLYAYVFISAY